MATPPTGSIQNPLEISSFIRWAKDVAVNNEIMLLYATFDYKEMGHNCVMSLRRQGVINVGIMTTDQNSTEYFALKDIHVFNVANIVKGIPVDVRIDNNLVPPDIDLSRLKHQDWANRWNDRHLSRWTHWMLRHYLALQLLKEGVGVYQVDVDTVFLDDPYKWLDPEADLEGQTQDWPKVNAINFGIGHVAATLGGVLHWETTNNLMRYSGDDPQSLENLVLIDPLIAHVGFIESKPCRSGFEHMCEWNRSPLVNYRRWPQKVLPMGYEMQTDWVYGNGNTKANNLIGIHVHATLSDFQRGKFELYRAYCKQHGIWFIQE